ncbi:ABC transporter permease [Paenibacillus caui]|uniref:ABC transporter permease n=1 Tax=Paenibacillus caui TaxID=2873927 RepID=UPI001CA90A5B|nr:FtsX-like permease family protein [Paenibacillus caui]
MVIHKRITRTMLDNKAQYLGSLVLILISCLLYTMFNQLSVNMDHITSSFETQYVQEDASFVTDKALTNIPELESKFGVVIDKGGVFDYAVSTDQSLRIFAENDKVNLYALIEGRALSGGDILLDPAYAKAHHIKVGDSIRVEGKDFTVSGFMSLPNYIYPLKKESDLLNDPDHFGIAVIGKDDFAAFHRGSSFYSVKVQGDPDSADSILAELKNELKSQNTVILKWINIDENPRVTAVTAKMANMNKVGAALPVTILLLTCILTGIVIWRMLKKEAVMIGTLYAQGYRMREIMNHYLRYPFVIAVIGGMIGTLLGALTLKPMLGFMVAYFNMPIDSVRFSIAHLAVSLLLPLLFLLISGTFIVRRALGHSPIELMRGGGQSRKIGFLERRLSLNKLKFSTKFKIREQLRSMPRSLFLLFGVALATMLLLLGFTMKSSMDFLLKDTYEDAYKYQYEYVFNSLQQGHPASGEPFSMSPFTETANGQKSFIVYGVRPDTKSISLADKAGSPLRFDQVIVTKPLADRLNIKQNDTIGIISKLDSGRYSIKVDRIADSYIGEYIFMPLTAFNEMLGYPQNSYLGVWSMDKLHFAEDQLLSSSSASDAKAAFASVTQPIQAMLGIISLMSFVIGLIVIYVVTSLIIEENKENISLMKVLGYKKKEVFSLILNSSTYIVILGFIIGVPLLLASMQAMFQSVADSTSFVLPVKINYAYLGLGFVIIILIYELSKAFSKKKINRISMIEALKSRAE